MHSNGIESTLLYFGGTLAITYRGGTYNIPVEIYLSETYPEAPPRCYVRPTPDMMVKPGHRHVDVEGLVYLPYLHDWRASTHNLVELCTVMASIFQSQPPVFAKPPTAATAAPVPATRVAATAVGGQPGARLPPPYASVAVAATADPKQIAVADLTARLQSDLQQFYARARQELDSEFSKQARLQQGQQDIAAAVDELREQKEALGVLQATAREKCDNLDRWSREQEEQGPAPVDPDALIIPADIRSKQLADLLSESAALEDALYYLDRALSRGAVDLESFLREVRSLARRQFLAKAHIQKLASSREGSGSSADKKQAR